MIITSPFLVYSESLPELNLPFSKIDWIPFSKIAECGVYPGSYYSDALAEKEKNQYPLEFARIVINDFDQIPQEALLTILDIMFDSVDYIQRYRHFRKSMRYTDEIVEEGFRLISRKPSSIIPTLRQVDSVQFFRLTPSVWKKDSLVSALMLFRKAYNRDDSIDTILDLTSVIESMFKIKDEQSLKARMVTHAFLIDDKLDVYNTIKKLYVLRNDIAHGNRLPTITETMQLKFINTIKRFFIQVIKNDEIPNADLILDNELKRHYEN